MNYRDPVPGFAIPDSLTKLDIGTTMSLSHTITP